MQNTKKNNTIAHGIKGIGTIIVLDSNHPGNLMNSLKTFLKTNSNKFRVWRGEVGMQ